MMRAAALVGGGWLGAHACLARPAFAEADTELRRLAPALDVPRGDEIVLNTGDRVMLADLRAPAAVDGPDGSGAAEAAARARAALAELVMGRSLGLRHARSTRYGDLNGSVYLLDAARGEPLLNVNEDLVGEGHVRVAPSAMTPFTAVQALLNAESIARRAGLGLWSLKLYRIRGTAEADALEGRFGLVEGFVLETAEVAGRVFLNFGKDWRTDTTVTIPPEARPDFAALGLEPLALARRSVRARGIWQSYNGPSLELRIPAALEIVS
jgi:endonuclease YncB( thermonuclease family)